MNLLLPRTLAISLSARPKALPTKLTVALFHLAMLLAITLPLHAADNPASLAARAIKQRVNPVYPEIAKRLHVSGVVKIEATVNGNGAVTATKIIAGNSMLSAAAEDAVHQWKFVPAAEGSTVEVEVNFAQAR